MQASTNDTRITKGAVLMTVLTIASMFIAAIVVALIAAMNMQPAPADAAEVKPVAHPWSVDKSVDKQEVELGQVSVTTHDHLKHSFLYLRDDGDLGFWPVGAGWERDEDVNEAVHGDYGAVEEVTILVKLDSGEMRMYDWHPGDNGYQRRM